MNKILETQLIPGGALAVYIAGFDPREGLRAVLVCHDGDSEKLATIYRHLPEDSLEISGLRPGNYEIWLTMEEFPMRSTAIAVSERFQVEAGGVTHVSLDMGLLLPISAVGQISGSLTIQAPELWSDTAVFKSAALVLSQEPPTQGFLAMDPDSKRLRISQMRSLELNGEARAWSIEGVPSGDYELTIAPFGFSTPISVTSAGAKAIDIVVPPLARTLVELWHENTHVQDAMLFATVVQGWSMMAEPEPLPDEPKTQGLTIISLPGNVDILAEVPGYPPLREEFAALVGWNYLRLEVVSRPQAILRAVNGDGVEIPFFGWFKAVVSPVGGNGILVDRSMANYNGITSGLHRGNLYFSEAGTYLVEFPRTVDGPNIDSLVVSVELGKVASYDVVVDPSTDR